MSDKCTDMRERITEAMVSGEPISPELAHHLAGCPECARFAEALRDDDRRMSSFANAAKTSIERVEENVQRALRERTVVPLSTREGIMFKRMMWIAAAAVLVTAAISGIGFLTGRFGAATPAWATVQEKIAKAVSVTYLETYETKEVPTFVVQTSASQDGRLRSVYGSGAITIMDFRDGVTLNLWPQNKTALVRKRVGTPERKGLFNYVDWIKTLHKKSATFVGKERIDGVQTDVFEVEPSPYESHRVWVNAATGMPVRVVTTTQPADTNIAAPSLMLNLGDYGGDKRVVRSVSLSNSSGINRAMKITLSSFNWNAALDDSLFSVQAPPGYRVEERQSDASFNGAKDLAAALRTWVDLSGGSLPAAIEDMGSQSKVPPLLKAKYDRHGKPEDEMEQALTVADELLKGLMFAEQMSLSGNWSYRGSVAKVGDPASVICSWREEGSDEYRAVYGDFRIDKMAREQANH